MERSFHCQQPIQFLPEFEGWKAQPGNWQATHIRSDAERGGMKALVSGLCFWWGTEGVGSLRLKQDRDRSWWCFSGTLIFSSVHCFLSTRRSCSKTKPNARFTIINRYICTLYTHYANPSRPVSPPASKMRNYRESHRERKWFCLVMALMKHTYTHPSCGLYSNQTCPELTVIFLYCDMGHIFRTIRIDKTLKSPVIPLCEEAFV